MKNVIALAAMTTMWNLSGCVAPDPDGKNGFIFDPTGSKCIGVKQFVRDFEAELTKDDIGTASATTESQQLVSYKAQLAILANQSQQACEAFHKNRITWEQYQDETGKIREELSNLSAEFDK